MAWVWAACAPRMTVLVPWVKVPAVLLNLPSTSSVVGAVKVAPALLRMNSEPMLTVVLPPLNVPPDWVKFPVKVMVLLGLKVPPLMAEVLLKVAVAPTAVLPKKVVPLDMVKAPLADMLAGDQK